MIGAWVDDTCAIFSLLDWVCSLMNQQIRFFTRNYYFLCPKKIQNFNSTPTYWTGCIRRARGWPHLKSAPILRGVSTRAANVDLNWTFKESQDIRWQYTHKNLRFLLLLLLAEMMKCSWVFYNQYSVHVHWIILMFWFTYFFNVSSLWETKLNFRS